ncbi:MAG: hypothetical protein JWO47_576 [Candidatus Saccharibacteria bacterium]|nr:hypothetical protein [Candidatus Saccharibacteria bacterium]
MIKTFVLCILGVGIIYLLQQWLRLKINGKSQVDNKAGLLLAFYTRGNAIFRLVSGEQNGTSFKIFETAPDPYASSQLSTLTPGAVIYAIDLDFNTQAHIIGVGKTSPGDNIGVKQALHDFDMEKVDLEGDFSQYFDVFCALGQQVQTRYVLNPKGMQDFIKYIQNNCWEIVGDQMYVVGQLLDALAGADIIEDSSVFIKSISPSIKSSIPGGDPVHHEKAYGEYDGPVLNCPICSKPMTLTNNIHLCPEGHGVLINGRELLDIHAGKLDFVINNPNPQAHSSLTCPFCKNTLIASNYLEGKTVIDSCPHCAFRWLDADEVQAVMPPTKITK